MGKTFRLRPSELANVHIDTPIEVFGDAGVIADCHIPLINLRYTETAINRLLDENLSSLIIAGDFFNFDSLSQYDPKQQDAGFEVEYKTALTVMRKLCNAFENVYFLWGNHDARFHKALNYKTPFSQAMLMVFGALGDKMLSQIQFTNLDHCWLYSNEEPYYICHPSNYSRSPLYNARVLAAKYNANVLVTHSHHCAVGYATDGEKVVAEIGGLFDVDKTAYLKRSTNHPEWQNGFAFIKDGLLTVSSPKWSIG